METIAAIGVVFAAVYGIWLLVLTSNQVTSDSSIESLCGKRKADDEIRARNERRITNLEDRLDRARRDWKPE